MKAGRGLFALFGVLAAAALWAPLAQAGTYDVRSCSIDGGVYPNNAWHVGAGNATRIVDTACGSGNTLGVRLAPSASIAPGTYAALRFSAPPQTTIADFALGIRHRWSASDATGSTTYNLVHLGSAFAISLVGKYDPNWVNRPGQLYWGGSGTIDKSLVLSRAMSPIAMGLSGPTFLDLRAGCWAGETAACATAATVAGRLDMSGARVTIADNLAPQVAAVGGQGLLAPGVRAGSEPVTFNASDNAGIRRAELVDVTDPAHPSTVATKDVACDYTRPRPCPDLPGGSLAASNPIAGHRAFLVRVTDAAGNQAVTAPFAVSARGGANGVGGGDGARLTAGFPGHTYRGRGKRRHRVGVLRPTKTVAYGHAATVRGVLRNSARQPVAGAQLRLLVRELRLGAGYVDRGAVTTRADGHFAFRIPRGSSRRYRIAYRAYVGDDQLTAKSDVTFNTKARITVHVARHTRSHGTVRFRGSLRGRPLPPRGVTVELQAHQPGRGWRTVKTTRTRRGGGYSTRYRFNSSHGRFTFRMRLRPNDSYPYARGTSRAVRVRVG